MASTCANPKPGASSGSPTRVQGPKALGRQRLPSRATGRELEGKQGCRDRTGTHMGSWAYKGRTFTTVPPRRALPPFHFKALNISQLSCGKVGRASHKCTFSVLSILLSIQFPAFIPGRQERMTQILAQLYPCVRPKEAPDFRLA